MLLTLEYVFRVDDFDDIKIECIGLLKTSWVEWKTSDIDFFIVWTLIHTDSHIYTHKHAYLEYEIQRLRLRRYQLMTGHRI